MSTQAVDHPTKQVNILPGLWMGVLVGEKNGPSSVSGVSCVAKVAEDGDCRPDLEDSVPNEGFGEAGSLCNEKIEASAVYVLVYDDALISLYRCIMISLCHRVVEVKTILRQCAR
jgi:hypothetical protein